MGHKFDEVVSSRERLREIIGVPSFRVANKTIDHIDPICRRFIAASPYIVIATNGADGLLDLSPRGDPAGFVHMIDEKTLSIPDRLGNKRVDTLENLLDDPRIGLIFLIPGYDITLRVSGTGRIVRDAELQEEHAVEGKQPNLVLVVSVEQAFMHCAKSMARSKIWQPEGWPDISDVPSLAEAMVAHSKIEDTIKQMQDIIDYDFENKMY